MVAIVGSMMMMMMMMMMVASINSDTCTCAFLYDAPADNHNIER